ncbi:hypothetical protein SKAU_G00228880 [Synaphobranchus kaupii]|uniref:Uncharacterized protein n=1 Tax=Synaphobranchus kaupii TaxID=118154 RepID=A0A9Q1F572_SYNKA|nr:hypothetical protein SKAU_G00228880 [Synaphobranchus kaupii]
MTVIKARTGGGQRFLFQQGVPQFPFAVMTSTVFSSPADLPARAGEELPERINNEQVKTNTRRSTPSGTAKMQYPELTQGGGRAAKGTRPEAMVKAVLGGGASRCMCKVCKKQR